MQRPRASRPDPKKRFREEFQRRFFLRFHITLIFLGTLTAGYLTNQLFYFEGWGTMAQRFGIAVVAAYLAFLGLIRIWMIYVGVSNAQEDTPDVPEVDEFLDLGSSTDIDASSLVDGGASFDGGGASGSWSDAMSLDGCGGVDEGCVAGLLLLLVIAGVMASGGYLIYIGPSFLTEIAFEAILAALLVRRARKVERRGWIDSVFRKTAIPFVIVLVLAIAFGVMGRKACPGANRIAEVISCLRNS